MTKTIYRYEFAEEVSLIDVQCSVLLSFFATESVFGETRVQLETSHELDEENHQLLIHAETEVGEALNRILYGFLRREFTMDQFSVERLHPTESEPQQPTTTTSFA